MQVRHPGTVSRDGIYNIEEPYRTGIAGRGHRIDFACIFGLHEKHHAVFLEFVRNVADSAYRHPDFGECRRVTASRLCLVGERAGIDSEAFQELLKAISDVAENDQYDGRAVESWFGLVGLEPPKIKAPELVSVRCPRCRTVHWALEERGRIFEDGVCGPCWSKHYIAF